MHSLTRPVAYKAIYGNRVHEWMPGWVVAWGTEGNSQGIYPVAIVEKPDGTVFVPDALNLMFLDARASIFNNTYLDTGLMWLLGGGGRIPSLLKGDIL